ncbi:hypothetical protein DSL72_005288 [Monilinia vaccinii-corymbosi]|uniref:Uncharacterized protein n=1 Tax=Monilinia vaccinii-corymbosi TaxID=61207 RepID=A0A8A3PES5_9HELO|nr:hypothetical protein DSL72_005288 [Monilinia vaccinii-corymbosi]
MTSITLTAKETDMLVAVMTEMEKIPSSINFENVAKRVDVKYGKNARQSFKKLFEKLKAQAGPSPSDGDGTAPPKTPSPTKRASPKKKVGPTNAPIKATPNLRGKKAVVKKQVKEEDVDSDEILEMPVLDDENGKSQNKISSVAAEKTTGKHVGVSHTMEPSESLQNSDEDTGTSIVDFVSATGSLAVDAKLDADQLDANDQLLADDYGMSLPAYREWRDLNDYSNFMDEV